jgi:hypothetical protein
MLAVRCVSKKVVSNFNFFPAAVTRCTAAIHTTPSAQLTFHGKNCSCCNGFPSFTTSTSTTQNKSMLTRKNFSTFDSFASDDFEDESNPFVKELLVNNRRWVKETHDKDPEFFTKLAQPQKPKYLYFGCADSRVPANEILGLG